MAEENQLIRTANNQPTKMTHTESLIAEISDLKILHSEAEIVESVPNEETMPRADSPAIWNEYRAKAEALKATAETLQVTSIEDTAGQKLARTARLSLREIRLAVEKRRKELVEHKTKEVARINGAAKEVRDYCETLEGRLLEQEQFIERETARIEDVRRTDRANALRPFMQSLPTVDLGKIEESEFLSILADAKDLHEMRLKREAEAEAARIAKEKEEAEERERIRQENARLKAEAEAREAVIAEERRKAAEALRIEREEAEAKAAAERKAALQRMQEMEAEAKAEREAEAVARKAEYEKALIREREIEEQRAKERAEADMKRKAAEQEARRERQAREEIERKQAAAEAAEKMRLAKIAAEEKRKLAAEAESARLAALAPDKEKLIAFADKLSGLAIPEVTTAEAAVFAASIHERITSLAERIKEKAALL